MTDAAARPGLIAPPLDIDTANRALDSMTAEQRIRWAIEQFGERSAVLASMQKTSSLLLHVLAASGRRCQILFVDTGFHFRETLAVRDELGARYGLPITTLHPELTPKQQRERYGFDLHDYIDGQPDCCRMRKEEPFLAHVRAQGIQLVMLGLRRAEGGARHTLRPLERDPRYDGYALHPFVDWTAEEVNSYLERHAIPINALHAQSYPSIGCSPCTTPVEPGEDERAGRWRHLRGENGQPQYCGINYSDGGGI